MKHSLTDKTIVIGADHGGFRLKQQLVELLRMSGYAVEDAGPEKLDPDDDYPGIAFAVGEAVAAAPEEKAGILVCRSGGGMTIAANKVPGVRAVTVTREDEVVHARTDNDANVISLPADWITQASAENLVRLFLETPFSEAERHARRIQQIAAYEAAQTGVRT
jgi:ribose 5-phosphate isomerase B